ncbi:hypothetical protein [Terrisporobacter sp.]|uniref:hypothetical protein n=1 Tax=Terrisporobacter sp. TaxID=1965305 RepID=UPI0039925BB9
MKYKKYIILYRFTLDGQFIEKVKFNHSIAKERGWNYSCIRNHMMPTWSGRCKGKSALGSLWIREEDFSKEELHRKIERKMTDPRFNLKVNKQAKRIIQRDELTGEVIHIWDSINQAGNSEITGYNVVSISRVLSGKQTKYAGCLWQLA